jgi:CRISPR-associated protein Cas5t
MINIIDKSVFAVQESGFEKMEGLKSLSEGFAEIEKWIKNFTIIKKMKKINYEIFILEILTQTSTFRNPEFQNFHKTLDLPTPTTIIGLAGAALGLSPKASQDFFNKNIFFFGVYGKSYGKTKDTWKYTNTTKSIELANYHPNYLGSVITKEILFKNNFIICFGTENLEAYEELLNAFYSPIYSLTLGNSDSLAFIKRIETTEKETENDVIKHCIIGVMN